MAEIFDICRQDFTAAKLAFEERDFRLLNILGNRLMSNVLFGSQDEKLLALPGFFIKDVALDFLKDDTKLDELHRIAKVSIGQVDEAFKRDFDLARFWSVFLKYWNDVRKTNLTATERKAYKDNAAFTVQAMSFLSNELFKDDFVFQENSLIIKGVLQELDRIVRCHGADDSDIILGLLLRVIDWINDYYRQAFSSAQGVVNVELVKSQLSPLLEAVKEWRATKEILPFTNGSTILCDAILEWRRCFIRYLERGRLSPEAERRIELPLDTKKRIGDTIAEALQRDVAKRGKK
jgi:hypothetical protein